MNFWNCIALLDKSWHVASANFYEGPQVQIAARVPDIMMHELFAQQHYSAPQ